MTAVLWPVNPALVEWCIRHGLNPTRIVQRPFKVFPSRDGTWWSVTWTEVAGGPGELDEDGMQRLQVERTAVFDEEPPPMYDSPARLGPALPAQRPLNVNGDTSHEIHP